MCNIIIYYTYTYTIYIIDTEQCFGPYIFILSCESGITMTMTCMDTNSNTTTINNNNQQQQQKKKYIWLPRRSLLCLTGNIKYTYILYFYSYIY